MAKEVEKRSGKATRQRYKKDRREAVVQVRMNAEELALLDGKRGGRTRSNYLRGALYGSAGSHTEHEVVADTPQLDRMLMELNRIGVNINQIARAFNARVKGMGASPFLSGLLLHAPTRCRRHIGGRERGWA